MIANSSLFKKLINTYTDPAHAKSIIAGISVYEKQLETRIPLNKIDNSNFITALNYAIEYIEKCGRILSWVQQLELNTALKRENASKRYEIEKIKVSKAIDQSEALLELTSKEEKKSTRAFMMKEQLIILEQELDDVKLDAKVAERFVKDAEGLKDLAYAYYQAVKRIGGD